MNSPPSSTMAVDQLGPLPVFGRGEVLMRLTREAMTLLDELDDQNDMPPGLMDNSLGREVLVWIAAISEQKHLLSAEVISERGQYYRALFNLSTDKRTRLRLVDDLEAMFLIVRLMQTAEPEEIEATLIAAVANLVYEESTKYKLMALGNIPALFGKLIKHPSTNVMTHGARAIFSLTTVFDFKRKFATEPGLLESLITCLSRESKQLVMNAAGAIANIAIHPESKIPIVHFGALTPLMELGNTDDDEGVLHQVARCLFSLAAEKQNRPVMCQRGIMQVIGRFLNFTRHPDILAGAIGCFGNLAMTEVVAQENSIGAVLRILPILADSQHATLDRQAARVLFAFSFRPQVRQAMAEQDKLKVLIRKLDSTDEHVIRDVSGMLSSVVAGNMELKQTICDLGGFKRLITVFERYASTVWSTDLWNSVTRAIYAILNCDSAKQYICREKPAVLGKLCQVARQLNQPMMTKNALGALANIACQEQFFGKLLNCHVLQCGTEALFLNPRVEARKQAGRLLYNMTRRYGTALSYMTKFGGPDGEDRRLTFDFKALFEATFAMLPADLLELSDLIASSGSGCLVLRLNCSSPLCPSVAVLVYEPLVRARCPKLLQYAVLPGAQATTARTPKRSLVVGRPHLQVSSLSSSSSAAGPATPSSAQPTSQEVERSMMAMALIELSNDIGWDANTEVAAVVEKQHDAPTSSCPPLTCLAELEAEEATAEVDMTLTMALEEMNTMDCIAVSPQAWRLFFEYLYTNTVTASPFPVGDSFVGFESSESEQLYQELLHMNEFLGINVLDVFTAPAASAQNAAAAAAAAAAAGVPGAISVQLGNDKDKLEEWLRSSVQMFGETDCILSQTSSTSLRSNGTTDDDLPLFGPALGLQTSQIVSQNQDPWNEGTNASVDRASTPDVNAGRVYLLTAPTDFAMPLLASADKPRTDAESDALLSLLICGGEKGNASMNNSSNDVVSFSCAFSFPVSEMTGLFPSGMMDQHDDVAAGSTVSLEQQSKRQKTSCASPTKSISSSSATSPCPSPSSSSAPCGGSASNPAPMTRARKAMMLRQQQTHHHHQSMGDSHQTPEHQFSPFIQSMIDSWTYLHLENGTEESRSEGNDKKRMRHLSASSSSSSSGYNINVHKRILSTRSKYFKTLFEGGFSDSQQEVLQFHGPVECLVVMVRYLYAGVDSRLSQALRDDPTLCWASLLTAHEYGLEGLQYQCEHILSRQLASENAAPSAYGLLLTQISEEVSPISVPFLKITLADLASVKLKRTPNVAKQVLENVGMFQFL